MKLNVTVFGQVESQSATLKLPDTHFLKAPVSVKESESLIQQIQDSTPLT